MKKIKIILAFLIAMFANNINVFAASGSLSVSSNNVYVGDSFTVTVNVKSAASWNVHVISSGPVSNCTITQADATSDALDTNKSFSTTCTATGEGTITINLSGDVTSAVDGNAVLLSGNKSVTVSAKPKTTPDNNNNNNNNNNNSNNNTGGNTNNNTSSTNDTTQTVDNRSDNNKIKELSIDGYELTKVDDNNYTLTVNNSVDNININAISEDSKAKIEGTGKHELAVGENNIEVIITAENGSQNKINIKVTRKDGYYISDIDEAVNDKEKSVIVILNKEDEITKEIVDKVKTSKKEVSFNYYDDNKKLIYSWTLNGKKIDETMDINHNITFDSENKEEIKKLVNYSEGLIVNLAHSGKLPSGTKIKLYVGDKYKDKDLVNIYYYNKDEKSIEKIDNNIEVTDGYIEFSIDHASEYYVTLANLNSNNTVKDNNKTFIIIIVISILLLLAVGYIIYDKVIKKNKEIDNQETNNDIKIENSNQNELQENITFNNNTNINDFNQSINNDSNIEETNNNSNIDTDLKENNNL